MLLGLELGLAQRWEKAFSGLLVMGDSDLVVAFMQHHSRPGQQALVAAVTRKPDAALWEHGVGGCASSTSPGTKLPGRLAVARGPEDAETRPRGGQRLPALG